MRLNNFAVNENQSISAVVLHFPPSLQLANEQFFDFCQVNRELRIERTASGDYEIMAPTGGQTSCRNSRLTMLLTIWAEQEGSGVVFDSMGGFILPNGAMRSPDASWVKRERLVKLTPEQKQGFLPLCPDFIIELRSPSDSIKSLQDKMQEYRENGASLGWLIDPKDRRVFIYQPAKEVIIQDSPEFLTADDVLTGFRLDLKKIWDVGF